MKRQDNQFLFKEKVYSEGKDEYQADKEVKEFNFSQKQFKLLYNENQRNLREIEKLNNIIKKIKDSNFKLRFELDKNNKQSKEEKGQLPNHNNHIIRIINQMEINKEYKKSELAKSLLMDVTDFNNCFLIIDKCKKFNYEITKEGRYRKL